MRQAGRERTSLKIVAIAMMVWLMPRPDTDALSGRGNSALKSDSFQQALLKSANDTNLALHQASPDERNVSDYLRAIDAYRQVARTATDARMSAEALAHEADLMRELADRNGDYSLYRDSIEMFRKIAAEHPDSGLVGDALMSVAQIYEENLQDLDGAADAYRTIIDNYPNSIMAREARAVLSRFEDQISARPSGADVQIARGENPLRNPGETWLENVRNFTGPDYARIVLDLSGPAAFSPARTTDNKIGFLLSGAGVSAALDSRRFIIGQSDFLKRISVSDAGNGKVAVEIELARPADCNAFALPGPDRLVIDLRTKSPDIAARPKGPPADVKSGDVAEAAKSFVAGKHEDAAIKTLPPLPQTPPAIATNNASPAKKEETGVRCVVIDPGHGGHDTGTIGPSGLKEKDVVLDVARKLRDFIKSNYPAVEVLLTRDSDRFLALEERSAIANSHRADLFISIHANASPSRAASGIETFFVSPDRAKDGDRRTEPEATTPEPVTAKASSTEAPRPVAAAQTPADKPREVLASVSVGNRIAASRELAGFIQSGLVRGIGATSPKTAANRGVKHAAFAVLVGSSMPSVLAEISFVSNPRDENLLQTGEFRNRIAASLYNGLSAYLKKNHPAESAAKPAKATAPAVASKEPQKN